MAEKTETKNEAGEMSAKELLEHITKHPMVEYVDDKWDKVVIKIEGENILFRVPYEDLVSFALQKKLVMVNEYRKVI